jgi:hypothetical protein
MSTKAEQALALALAARFEITQELDVTNEYTYGVAYHLTVLRRLHGSRPVHGYDSLEVRTHGPKLLNAVLRFGDKRPFGSKTCTSIPALTRALLDVRNDRRGRKALAAHLDIPFTN